MWGVSLSSSICESIQMSALSIISSNLTAFIFSSVSLINFQKSEKNRWFNSVLKPPSQYGATIAWWLWPNQLANPQSHQIINPRFITPYERKRNERGMANFQNAFMWLDREWNLCLGSPCMPGLWLHNFSLYPLKPTYCDLAPFLQKLSIHKRENPQSRTLHLWAPDASFPSVQSGNRVKTLIKQVHAGATKDSFIKHLHINHLMVVGGELKCSGSGVIPYTRRTKDRNKQATKWSF